ncbi:lytic polysaccharide monooxygenase [Paenibacillus profundus]|uniref:Lytic polysaccharide monooxygenase n=1 Tax=Paenibacillus profundus TaxID=1173085 RepID=A0ABS8YP85_9BACL|nr:lytic polysaccharide monooxygenase [Paenibacillus profundus]MCE5173628.1 lytic polysaccharide monooxygenase [Paenibacillus profundus]
MVTQPRIWNHLISRASPLFAAFGLMTLGLTCTLIFAENASAHGYIESPASRAVLCKQGLNKDCGQVQYEPQSVEGKGSFPQGGPADGQIAGGGVFAELNEQTADRWHKVALQGGKNTFKWHLTAPHATAKWNYYITKKDWDPNKPLTRADLEQVPFCSIDDGGKRPPNSVTHECSVPTDRSGYHLILGVWEIADTGNAFYQVIDVNLVNDGTGEQAPTAPGNVASPSQTQTSIAINWSAATAPNGIKAYEVHRNGVLIGTTTQTSYEDAGLTPNTSYTYTVRAVDSADNKSPFSAPLTVSTIKDDGDGGGDGGDGGNPPLPGTSAWEASKVYNRGDRVEYKDLEYEALYWTQNNEPDVSDAWKLVSDVVLDWNKDKAYTGGDQVKHNGAVYSARWWTRGEEPGRADVWKAAQ